MLLLLLVLPKLVTNIVCLFFSKLHIILYSKCAVNLDDCWQISRDANGTIVPDPSLFPNGMKPLVDYVHSKGLKFGLYSGNETRHYIISIGNIIFYRSRYNDMPTSTWFAALRNTRCEYLCILGCGLSKIGFMLCR